MSLAHLPIGRLASRLLLIALVLAVVGLVAALALASIVPLPAHQLPLAPFRWGPGGPMAA
jgi:hypothetical protein